MIQGVLSITSNNEEALYLFPSDVLRSDERGYGQSIPCHCFKNVIIEIIVNRMGKLGVLEEQKESLQMPRAETLILNLENLLFETKIWVMHLLKIHEL